jgi:cell division septation protein DedD
MQVLLILISLAILPATMLAQGRSGRAGAAAQQTPDSVFSRAIALNNEQRGTEARALIDSLLRATQPTSPAYADALFWTAVLAETEQVAEAQYNRIVREFPLHRRAEESLIRLAQMEMARGNRSVAQRHLDRIIVEHPYGQFRSKASYWRARLFFEENELDRACAELGLARARLPAGDVELKTEIDFAARRCVNVPTPATAGAGQGRAGRAADTAGAAARTRAGGAAAAAQKAAPPTKSAAMFAVQAAAFPLRENAQAFTDALKARGYDARLVDGGPLFRVWIGRFANRAQATALATELREKNVSSGAFVVEAGGR